MTAIMEPLPPATPLSDHPINGVRVKPLWPWFVLTASLFPIMIIIMAQLAQWSWYGELASHWTLHEVIALMPVMVVFRRDPWWGRLFIILLIIGSWPWWLTAFAPRATVAAPVASLTLATANVCIDNTKRGELHAALIAQAADVLVLQEVSSADRAALLSASAWPHQEWHLQEGAFSLAVLSRYRLVTTKIHRMHNVPMIEVLIDAGEAPLRVFVLHPPSPVTPLLTNHRDQCLALLAQAVHDQTEPVVVAGDWNLTAGTAVWHLFMDFTKLRAAPGAKPATWPAFSGPLGIAIDHIVGRAVGLAPVQAFTVPGSDHRGLMTTVSLPAHW
jgi:endonuclease/exonuclease/phosphatase (EEP) superfamily protein YafD